MSSKCRTTITGRFKRRPVSMEEAGQSRNDTEPREHTDLQQRCGLLHCTPIIHLRLWDDTLELQSLDDETCRLRAEQLGRIAHLESQNSRIRQRYLDRGTLIRVIETDSIQVRFSMAQIRPRVLGLSPPARVPAASPCLNSAGIVSRVLHRFRSRSDSMSDTMYRYVQSHAKQSWSNSYLSL